MADKVVEKILRREKEASAEKSQWHQHFDDLARVMLPRRSGFASTTIPGERRTEDIFDGTPMQGARGLANAIGGMIRPQGIPEVEMKTDSDELDNIGEVKDWMADSEERLKNAFNNPKARFRQAAGEADIDLVVFGTLAIFEAESDLRDSLLFQTLHLKDVTPVFNDEGTVEGLFRRRKMPFHQAERRFGDKLSEVAKEKFKDKPDDKIELLHAVLKREDFKKNGLFAVNLPFADMWIEIQEKHKVSEGGFNEFPYIVARWDTSSGESMGRSPGMIALPDSDTLQSMGETILIAGQRGADPPLMAPNDGSFDAVNTFPGGLSYYDVETAQAVRGNPFFTLESGHNLPITRDMQQDIRAQVFAAFFRNILNLPIEGPQMTATEVIQRKEEFIREIGPVFGRLEVDYTAPMVERAFMIMLRGGGFLPIPEALQGQNIRFEYDSPVNRIRKQVEAAAARMWAAEMIELGQTKPRAILLINEEELGRFSAEALGIPKKIVNDADTVQKLDEQRQEALVVQQQAIDDREQAEIGKIKAEAADKAGLVQRPTNQAA